MKEEWKDIEGYKGLYQVSNTGRIRSWRKEGNCDIVLNEPKTLIPQKAYGGYRRTTLYIDGRGSNRYIHRLVAKAFIPNPDNKPVVNHKDCDKTNNNVKNLEWNTHAENHKHAATNGLKATGSSHGLTKINEDQVIKIRSMYASGNYSQAVISDKFNVSRSSIQRIVNRKSWTHI